MFLAPWFAIAGLVAAAGPVLIHLLNRRRYKVVEWAAMDFLREALWRSRRVMQLRDILLLTLRTLCILAFGLALARPYFSRIAQAASSNQPVHAVVLLDNSLSMSYEELDGTLLDQAKARAKELIDALPEGSRAAVIPVCGSPASLSLHPYPSREDALDALKGIGPVDRAATASRAVDLALEACRHAPELPAKRIYFVTDQQAAAVLPESLADQLRQLPAPVEVVQVSPRLIENAWIADFELQDGLADTQSPAVFLATIRYEGDAPRNNVVATLTVDGSVAAEVAVDLVPGQAREVQFPPYQFDVPAESGRPTLVPAEVSIAADRLPGDDRRALVAPVVAALPVLFVDQYGPEENPRQNRYGETFHLRRLLAPLTAHDQKARQLIEIRHTTVDRLDQSALEDARLVVMAGVSRPDTAVPLLREYVEQGGQLFLAAGAEFDPAEWNDAAWLDGLGILPAPLQAATIGRLPEEPGELSSFQIDFDTMVDDRFLLEQTSRQEMEDLYRLPYFFKAVAVDLGDDAMTSLVRATSREIDGRRAKLAEIDGKIDELTARKASPALNAEIERLQRERAALAPTWLAWTPSAPRGEEKLSPAELAERSRPQVLASYTSGLPFMVQRRVGRGTVLFVSSGIYPRWNTLALTNAVVIYDRFLRGMLQRPLPRRNLSTDEEFLMPVAAAERTAEFRLSDPAGHQEVLSVEAIEGNGQYGVTIRQPSQRGVYRLTAVPVQAGAKALDLKLWDVPLAINGPAGESDLMPDKEPDAEGTAAAAASDLWLVQGGAGASAMIQTAGHNLWKLLLALVLVALLAEIVLLAYTRIVGDRPA